LSCIDKHKNSSGFTLLEVLIALTLISLLGLAAFSVFPEVRGVAEKLKKANKYNYELLQLEHTLRSSVSRIQIPYWVQEITIEESSVSTRIPFWQGDSELSLKIQQKDGVLSIITPQNSFRFNGYEKCKISTLRSHDEMIIGLALHVKKQKQKEVVFQCAFGAIGNAVFSGPEI